MALPILMCIKSNSSFVFFWVGLAVFSDWLDGHLARKWQLTSDVGLVIDPLADFVVIASIMTYFTRHGIVGPGLWWLMFFRYLSIIIACLYLFINFGVKSRSNFLGKCSVCVFSLYGLSFLFDFNYSIQNSILNAFVFSLILSWIQYYRTYIKVLCQPQCPQQAI